MTTKRIRCSCGRVYDPVKRPACPDCGAPHVAAEPTPESGKGAPEIPVPAPSETPEPGRTPISINPRLIAIGTGVVVLLVIVFAFSRCGGREKTSTVHESPKPQPTASLTSTPTVSPQLTAIPTTTVPPPQPTIAPPTPSIAPPFPSPPIQFPPSSLTTDLVALIANAAPGATIKVPPGIYPGGLVVTKAIRLVGTSGQVWIQSEGRECLSVRAPGVFVQNVQFTCNGIGELPAISVADGADLELEGCKVQSNSAVGVTVTGNASLKALGSNFTAANGLAVRLTQGARANITQSSFNDSQLGLWLAQGATAELHSCAFERTGGQEAKGAIISLSNPKTTLIADDCHFTGNTGGINAITSATLTLTNCSFKNNGITPRGGSALGLVALFDNSTATLKGNTFEGNQQGVAVSEGSKLEMEKCQFSGSGVQGRTVIPSCQPIAVFGKGATAVIRNTGIFDSAQYAAVVMGGGKIQMEEVDISGTSSAGLVVGDRAAGAGEGEIKRCHFRNNGTGIGIFGASSATVEDCEFKENKDGIIVLDKDSRLNGNKLKFIANRDGGLFVHALGQATVADSDFQNNTRGAIAGVKGKSAERGTITLNDCRFSGSRTFAAGACAQSELNLTRCVFDGSDKTNIYKERGAIVQTDAVAGASPSPSPSASDESTATATPEPSATAQPHRRPTPRSKHRRPEDDVSRIIRRLLPPP